MPDMPDFDEATLAKLAREMAMNIRSAATIFNDYGLDEEQYYELLARNEFFKKAKEQFTLEWNATTSTSDRVRIGSLAFLEQLLPALGRRALDKTEPLPAVTDVAKLFARNAGVGEARSEGKGSDDRFVITINLGADSETYNKSIDINPDDIDPGKLRKPSERPAPRALATAGARAEVQPGPRKPGRPRKGPLPTAPGTGASKLRLTLRAPPSGKP